MTHDFQFNHNMISLDGKQRWEQSEKRKEEERNKEDKESEEGIVQCAKREKLAFFSSKVLWL